MKIVKLLLLLIVFSCDTKKNREEVAKKQQEEFVVVKPNYFTPNLVIWSPLEKDKVNLEKRKIENSLKEDYLKEIELSEIESIAIGNVNVQTANIYSEPSFNSDIIKTLANGSLVHIQHKEKKFEQYINQFDRDLNGFWVNVTYRTKSLEDVKGYIFDDLIRYHLKESLEIAIEDTVTVHNEREFLEGLKSNRLIEIKADTLNFEKYFIKNKSDHNTTYDDLKYTDNETSYLTDAFDDGEINSLGLANYHDLILRGSNKKVEFIVDTSEADVITFEKCNNLLIENINFYHDNGASCFGDVVVVTNSNYITFNNIEFNGTGSVGCRVSDSDTINFKNSKFYKNNAYGISSENSSRITVNNCQFYDNSELYAVIKSNFDSYEENEIKINDCYITNNHLYYGYVFETLNSDLLCDNCIIENNEIRNGLINSNIGVSTFTNTKFLNNVGGLGSYLLEVLKDERSYAYFKNSTIKNNHNFYRFSKEQDTYSLDDSSIVDNIYYKEFENKSTKENSAFIHNKLYNEVHYDDLKKNTKDQVLIKNNYIAEGLYKIRLKTIEGMSFYGVDFKFMKKAREVFHYAYGNIKNGKLDGVWRFTYNEFEDFTLEIPFKEGKAYGSVKVKGFGDKLLITGEYLSDKKTGVWEYYNREGLKLKTLHYLNEESVGPYKIYYPNGNLREVYTDKRAQMGTETSYYDNGDIRSKIVFDTNGNIDGTKTKFYKKKGFFGTNGDEIEVVVTDAEKFIDVKGGFNKLKKYKNKIVLLVSNIPEQHYLGYFKTNEMGELDGFSKFYSFIPYKKEGKFFFKRDTNLHTVYLQNKNNWPQNEITLYKNRQDLTINIKKQSETHAKEIEYGGWFQGVKNMFLKKKDKNTYKDRDGVYEEYYRHGKLKERGYYKEGKKVTDSIKKFNP